MKKKHMIYLLLFAAIVSLSFVRYNEFNVPRDTIRGTFQNDIKNGDQLVQLTFESDNNSFVLYHEGTLADKGTYKEIEDNIYILKSDLQDTRIMLQDHNIFYYYDTVLSDSQIIEMQLTLDVPAYIDQTYF